MFYKLQQGRMCIHVIFLNTSMIKFIKKNHMPNITIRHKYAFVKQVRSRNLVMNLKY